MLWAVWIAGASHPSAKVLVIFVLGTVAMRSAGCVINDLADRDFDPFVKRTRDRPIASRRIAPAEAVLWFLVLIGIALALVLQLDPFTIRMSVIGAGLAVTYPLFKRFFPLPQFYLGVAFSWGVPMAFNAQTGAIPRVAWIIFFAGIIWAAVYDTMYAMVDRDDDLKIGVKSSAIVFGDMDKLIIGMLQALMLFALYLVGTQHGVRLLVQHGAGRRRRVLRLPAVADPPSQARRVLQGLPQQSLRGLCRVHRHPARVRFSRVCQRRLAVNVARRVSRRSANRRIAAARP